MAPLLEARGLSKRFGGIHAVRGVDFDLAAGEVHALVGENGAGKSTLVRVLVGVHPPDQGEVRLDGVPVSFRTPRDALRAGISVVSQEINLVPDLSVAANIFLGRFPTRSFLRAVDLARIHRESETLLAELGLALDPRARVRDLPFSSRQLVEIARALSWRARVLILDEPTSALSESEIVHLFRVLHRLRGEGVGVIYITHRLDELFGNAERATVMRDGQIVRTLDMAEPGVTKDDLIRLMIGRPVEETGIERGAHGDHERLRVEGLSHFRFFRDIGFAVVAGEVVGLTGLAGSGHSEVGLALFGGLPVRGGRVWLDGEPAVLSTPHAAVRRGLGLVPDDRKKQGLVLRMTVAQNVAMVRPQLVSTAGLLRLERMRAIANRFIKQLAIQARGPQQAVTTLSGGNQQKVVLSKWLAAEAGVLILSEPTRGIDVGAKAEIHRLIARLADEGHALLVISSELPEILKLCDVVHVMHEGRMTATLPRAMATEASIMAAAHGEPEARRP
ncbi:MAG: sugar ABC transporter ATP-binding protein [Candidatus Rokuibacteriota bacterium]